MRVTHLTWRSIVMVLLSAALSLAAGERDVRVVEAAAQGDLTAVRTLIQQGKDSTPRTATAQRLFTGQLTWTTTK